MKVSRIILALIASAIVATSYAESNDSVKLVRLEQTLQKEIKARESLKAELAIQKEVLQDFVWVSTGQGLHERIR